MGRIITDWGEISGDATLLFHHIPKTAGSTLNAVIRANYAPSRIHAIESPIAAALAAFKALSPKDRAGLNVVLGHGVGGLHALLEQPCVYVTMLRHPVDRILSQYYFIRQSPSHPLGAKFARGGMSLEDYVRDGVNLQADNGQVRGISGIGDGIGPPVAYGECTREMLDAAIQNLRDRYAVVGLTERFDEALLLMRRLFGWRRVAYARKKVTGKRPAREDVPSETIDMIREYNALDLELYAFACRWFEEIRARQSAVFGLETALFRLMNRYL